MRKRKSDKFIRKNNNHGTTLVEMIVCFALLAIFMVCTSIIISSVIMMYYNIKGEIYSREVSDIVMEKIESELDGTKYFEEMDGPNPSISNDNNSISLCDRTDTYVKLCLDSSENNRGFLVHYYEIIYTIEGDKDDISRKETDWSFDSSVYNGFEIKEVKFYAGGTPADSSVLGEYGLNTVNMEDYSNNVVLVLMTMESEKYGTYHFYRFVRMYDLPEDYSWSEGTTS